jgi:hypothetical protein
MNTHSRPPASQQPAHPPASVPNTVSGLRRIKCGPTYAYCARSHSTSFHRPRRRRRGPRTALHPSRVSRVISSSSSPSSSATYLRSAVLVSVVSSSEGTSGSPRGKGRMRMTHRSSVRMRRQRLFFSPVTPFFHDLTFSFDGKDTRISP